MSVPSFKSFVFVSPPPGCLSSSHVGADLSSLSAASAAAVDSYDVAVTAERAMRRVFVPLTLSSYGRWDAVPKKGYGSSMYDRMFPWRYRLYAAARGGLSSRPLPYVEPPDSASEPWSDPSSLLRQLSFLLMTGIDPRSDPDYPESVPHDFIDGEYSVKESSWGVSSAYSVTGSDGESSVTVESPVSPVTVPPVKCLFCDAVMDGLRGERTDVVSLRPETSRIPAADGVRQFLSCRLAEDVMFSTHPYHWFSYCDRTDGGAPRSRVPFGGTELLTLGRALSVPVTGDGAYSSLRSAFSSGYAPGLSASSPDPYLVNCTSVPDGMATTATAPLPDGTSSVPLTWGTPHVRDYWTDSGFPWKSLYSGSAVLEATVPSLHRNPSPVGVFWNHPEAWSKDGAGNPVPVVPPDDGTHPVPPVLTMGRPVDLGPFVSSFNAMMDMMSVTIHPVPVMLLTGVEVSLSDSWSLRTVMADGTVNKDRSLESSVAYSGELTVSASARQGLTLYPGVITTYVESGTRKLKADPDTVSVSASPLSFTRMPRIGSSSSRYSRSDISSVSSYVTDSSSSASVSVKVAGMIPMMSRRSSYERITGRARAESATYDGLETGQLVEKSLDSSVGTRSEAERYFMFDEYTLRFVKSATAYAVVSSGEVITTNGSCEKLVVTQHTVPARPTETSGRTVTVSGGERALRLVKLGDMDTKTGVFDLTGFDVTSLAVGHSGGFKKVSSHQTGDLELDGSMSTVRTKEYNDDGSLKRDTTVTTSDYTVVPYGYTVIDTVFVFIAVEWDFDAEVPPREG